MAYSRDPSLAFASRLPLPDAALSQRQPVTYQNVTLLQPVLEGHFVGQRIGVLRVDWLQCTAETFDDMDDALNGVRTFQGIWTCPRIESEAVSQYVSETLRFLERGHSLLDPHCTCRHWLSAERCRHLGVALQRADWCSLSRAPCEISAAQLARELAVDDVCRMPGLPFISAMERLCTIRVTPQGLVFSPLGTYLGPVRNQADLLRKLQTHPLPFEQSMQAYPDIEEDVRALARDGSVYILSQPSSSSSSPWVLHYLRPEAGLKVDQDIQALWHSMMNDQNKRLCRR